MLWVLLILCLSAARLEIYAHPLRSEFSEDAILVANNRIHVPLGRSVFVDPVNDLVVQTQPGDRCSVMVLEDDHLVQRPGRLSPGKFPCDFGPRDVMYTHYGSKSVALDRVRLQLRYDEHGETLVIPFVIEVEVVFTQMELLTTNMPLSVTHLRGTSDAIDGLRPHGTRAPGWRREFGETGAFPPDGSNHQGPGEHPTQAQLGGHDDDGEEGYIVSTDDQNLPITSFFQQDLQDLKIAYKPPSLDAERIFQLEFQVLDPEGAASDPFAFIIVVKPMNSLAPVVTHNVGQLLYEGQSVPLVTGHNLEIGDEDNLEAVSITVVDGLHHGVLLVPGAHGDRFSAADLAAGAVVYQHDGGDTYSDNVVFKMTDGEHHVEFLFPITVVPIDDEPPVVNVNTGLVLFEHQMMSVSPLALSASDIDSEDSTVKFTVVPPFSTVGIVLLRQSDAPEDPSSWKFNSADEVYEKEVWQWLQKDITEGKLFYKHVGPHNVNMDQFVFTVQDDNDPPNESGRATFVIRVVPVDNTHLDSEDRIASDDRGQVQSSRSRRPERVLRGRYLHQWLQRGNQDHYESSKRRQQADGPVIRRGPDLAGEGLLRGGPRPRGGRRLGGGAAKAEKLLS
ncbi:FRAS1-related extracellular matrix protein 2 isoform X3 [Syngnathus scovelli]|uniref:FRAS1-related extracellular matrix protein 2 isoform X3 n=1 Tax=Syngnathus scovelli TaxID=161590 RepID=UPI00210F7F37|nr:FRAS1-related extracellular matrix protein 2 isoform X2 [Syngnathus scovelli]